MTRFPLFLIVLLASCGSASAQNSAPSSHLVFDDNFDGDIIINEVRVPKTGEATYTYYEALGWRGTGAGYAGIQAHPKSHLYIFSIWDHKQHTAPIRAVYHGPGTETVGFGGEGTGLKSWNFELGWSTDVWYTLVARCWPVEDHTYYGFWSRAGDTKKWTHLVTMDVGAANARFRGRTDAFIEDWLNTGANARTTHLRGGWKRKMDGTWFPFGSGRYSVNSWDLKPGKRSHNFRNNWNGGIKRDKTGDFYFMISGGAATTATTNNPSDHSIKRKDTEPAYEKMRISQLDVSRADEATISVKWAVDQKMTPQFGYKLSLFDAKTAGKPIMMKSENVPHTRQTLFDTSKLNRSQNYRIHLQCTDILDRKSSVAAVEFKGKNLIK